MSMELNYFRGDIMSSYAKYKNQWLKEKRDRFMLVMPKGRKEELKTAAQAQGKSMTKFINDAIEQYDSAAYK